MSQLIHEHATGQKTAGDVTVPSSSTPEIPGNLPDGDTSADLPGHTNVKTLVVNALERFQGILFQNLPRRGLSTGLSELDEMSNGLEPRRVYVIAARPSMGKTSLLLQILGEVCLKQKIPSLLYTSDLTIPQVIDRLIFNRAMVPQCFFYDPEYHPCKGDLQRIQKNAQELGCSGLVLEDGRNITVEVIAAKAREERDMRSTGLIVIDHLHSIRSESMQPETSRKREMGKVIHELKYLARELGLPILVSAHLKRRTEGRLPRSGDIRESGTIKHEADFIGLVHREGPITYEDCYEMLIAKNNNGPLSTVGRLFIEEIQRFEKGPIFPDAPSVPSVPSFSEEEQEMTQASRDYRNEKDFPREMA
jgi:replicative DNA helicase